MPPRRGSVAGGRSAGASPRRPHRGGALARGCHRPDATRARPHRRGVARPEPTDPRIVSACNMLRQISTSAGLCDLKVRAWITLEGQRLWDEHGPCAALFGVVSAASALTIGLRADFRTGYDVGRRILALGAARGYEAATAAARARFAMSAAHWFESPETIIEHLRRPRELLLRSGEQIG